MKFSKRAMRMQPSATLAVTGKAKELKSAGKPVISFGAGEPDFPSPAAAMASARAAIDRGETHYTPATGIPELKERICGYYHDRFSLDYKPSQVLIGAGAKPVIFEALSALLDEGDEVLVFGPAWVSYVEQIRLCDGKEVIVDTTKTNFVPDMAAVRKLITPRTVGMLINTPCNPTGVLYGKELLREMADLALEKDLWIIFDEIYERLTYDGRKHINILNAAPDVTDRTLIVNGVSKAFAMTGWRIGYGLGPEALIKKMAALQGHLTSNACSIAQWASVGALEGAEEDVQRMHAAFEERKNLIVSLLEKMPYLSFAEPMGAFYAFVDINKCLGMKHDGKTLNDDAAFCTRLLESKYVAAVPGSAFLAPGYVRFSYANAKEEITEGMNRLAGFLNELES